MNQVAEIRSLNDARGGGDRRRQPPADIAAERALLGALLVDRTGMVDVADKVTAADFYKPGHGHIWQAICDLDLADQPVDPVTVGDRLEQAGMLDAAGGRPYLIDLLADAGPSHRAPHYALIVRRYSRLRGLILVAGELAEMGYNAGTDPDGAIERAQQAVFDLTVDDDGQDVTADQAVVSWWADLQEAIDAGGEIRGVTTGLLDLDRKLWGIRPGQLVVAAGRPGTGKSLLAGQIAMHAADLGLHVLLVSREMAKEEIIARLASARARVDHGRIRSGQLTEKETAAVSRAAGELRSLPIHFLDPTQPGSVAAIRARARRLAARHQLDLVIVDYLQIVDAPHRENRQVEVAEISRSLKLLAGELHIPVLALSQLSRALEQRADKRPQLADMRESGAIENDADVVIGIYRDEMYDPDTPDKGIAELIVLKQRSGETGTVKVAFVNHHGRFENMARI